MHITHIVESFSTGVYSWIKEVCNNTPDAYTNQVIFSEREETPKDYTNDFNNSTLTKVEMTREISPVKDLKSALQIRRELIKNKPSIIHCHSSKAGFITRLLRPFIKGKPKVVYTPHGISFERKDITTLSKSFYILLENIASLFSRTVLCCSKSESEIYKKYVPFSRCHYIENFCDVESFTGFHKKRLERLSSTASNTLQVITVGGIRTQKNPQQFAHIATAMRQHNINFTWVGDGESEDVMLLRQAGVKVTGWLSGNDVKQKLTEADIYLQTSLWEGMPISVIEAMAAGLPCVVSNIPGNTDCVEHGRDGYVFNKDSEVIDYIKTFLDRSKLIEFSKASRETAELRFSIDTFIKKLTDFYQSQLG